MEVDLLSSPPAADTAIAALPRPPLSLLAPVILIFALPVAALVSRWSSKPLPRPTDWPAWLGALPRYVTKGPRLNRAYMAVVALVIGVLLVDAGSYLNRSGFLDKPYDLIKVVLYLLAWLAAFGIFFLELRAVDVAKYEVRIRNAAPAVAADAAGESAAAVDEDSNGGVVEAKKEVVEAAEDEAAGPPISSAWRRSVFPAFVLLALLIDAHGVVALALKLLRPKPDQPLDYFHIVLYLLRYALELLLGILILSSYFGRGAAGYSRLPDDEAPSPKPDEPQEYRDFWGRMAVLLPFLWPSESLYLQFLVFFCFFLLLLGRVVNVLVPLQYKVVIDALTPGQGSPDTPKTPYFCWLAILIYVSLRFLQGGVGLLSATQNYFWIPVGQWTTRKVSVDAFAHLHSLGMQWHVQRKTGETLRILDRGTSSIVSLLSYILFNIFPVFVDIGIAVIFFVVQFDWVFGVIVLSTMVLYILCTVIVTEWRTQFRKDMIDLDNASRSLAVDSLLNFETVKYFNNEDYEVKRFDEAMQRFMVADRKSQASLNVLNLSQNLVITLGLLAGSLLAAREVVDGTLTTGDFVMFLTYLTQLYGPLNFMGTYYRLIQQSFIDMEKLIELFKERQTVKDKPNAKEIKFDKGEVVFENVSFSYDPRHPALKNVSFRIPAGKTVALVGHSGSGKTSVTRLLFRFYDVNSGRVLVDGVDVRDVTQKSLRAAIGVVPQDTVLFNDTIMHNIRYGKPSATDEEVIAAAKAAQLHDRIMTFPDGYNTKVGERGLRLSGGEKQRVAIARTMLKDPTIIILDEATSAMDSITERAIQESFKELCKDRSTLAIAHRLTTVQDADVIIVLKEGEIVEQGPFDELIKRGPGGHFYELWETRKKAEESGAADKPEEKKEARTERIGGHGGHGGGHGGHGGGHGR